MILFNQHLQDVIRVENLKLGGHKTEYCLYAMRSVLKDEHETFDEDFPDVLDSVAKIDFKKLNSTKKNQSNHDIIVGTIYDMLNILSKKHPEMMDKCKEIDSKLITSNPWFPEMIKKGDARVTTPFLDFRSKCATPTMVQKIAHQR